MLWVKNWENANKYLPKSFGRNISWTSVTFKLESYKLHPKPRQVMEKCDQLIFLKPQYCPWNLLLNQCESSAPITA